MKKILFLLLIVVTSVFAQGQTLYEKGNIAADTILLDETVISASYKASKTTPFSFKNISESQLDLNGRQLEPASVLQSTPSVTYNTDNGLFYGYSYYRLRGIDQTRLNVTLNGVPMNEPEDQGIYFNNYTNFLQSISDIQIIRGAGVSKSGVASYGGSINFDSKNIGNKFKDIEVSLGSYNTKNISTSFGGKRGWIRASYLKTDGYKYNSDNASASLFYGANLWPKQNIKLIGFVGFQENGMAWIGSPIDSIKKDRRYNSNKDWEQDEFLYVHNQIHKVTKINDNNSFKITVYHTYLNGWYNMDFGHFDGIFKQTMYKLDLNSNWFGGNFNYNLKIKNLNTNFGLSSYTYKRNHDNLMGFPFDYESYNKNYGIRNEISPYFKSNLKIQNTKIYGDVQYRVTMFKYNGPEKELEKKWDFFNWSAGITQNVNKCVHIYFGAGKNYREPTRTDLFGGMDEWTEDLYSDIIPEEVMDYELGTKYYGKALTANINYYYMDFKNEIVLNGQVGPNAIVIHSNVAKSYRTGIELDLDYKIGNVGLKNVSNLAKNMVEQDGTSLTQVLSPSFISVSDIIYYINKSNLGVSLRYNGESYIDLTNETKLPDYYTVNLYSNIKLNKFMLGLKVNNILNKLYYTNGVIGFDGNPGYFQQAGFNFLISLKYNI